MSTPTYHLTPSPLSINMERGGCEADKVRSCTKIAPVGAIFVLTILYLFYKIFCDFISLTCDHRNDQLLLQQHPYHPNQRQDQGR